MQGSALPATAAAARKGRSSMSGHCEARMSHVFSAFSDTLIMEHIAPSYREKRVNPSTTVVGANRRGNRCAAVRLPQRDKQHLASWKVTRTTCTRSVIAFHWVIAAAVLAELALGWWML